MHYKITTGHLLYLNLNYLLNWFTSGDIHRPSNIIPCKYHNYFKYLIMGYWQEKIMLNVYKNKRYKTSSLIHTCSLKQMCNVHVHMCLRNILYTIKKEAKYIN